MKARQLRNVAGFDAAAAEVVKRCAPKLFAARIRSAGAWIPPPSLKTVTPALLYNLAIGIERNDWNLYHDKREREERAAVVVPIRRDHSAVVAALRERCAAVTAEWLPYFGLDGTERDGSLSCRNRGQTERYGFEPTAAEFRAGLFGMGEGTP